MSKNTASPKIEDLDSQEIDALIARLQEAIDYDLALSVEDTRLLLSIVLTFAAMQERLSDKDVTLHKLRKLVGMVSSSEKLSHLSNTGDDQKKPDTKSRRRKQKPKARKKIIPNKVHHSLDDLKKGDLCPACTIGKLYKYEPAQLLRITGHTPFTPTLHLSERLHCNHLRINHF